MGCRFVSLHNEYHPRVHWQSSVVSMKAPLVLTSRTHPGAADPVACRQITRAWQRLRCPQRCSMKIGRGLPPLPCLLTAPWLTPPNSRSSAVLSAARLVAASGKNPHGMRGTTHDVSRHDIRSQSLYKSAWASNTENALRYETSKISLCVLAARCLVSGPAVAASHRATGTRGRAASDSRCSQRRSAFDHCASCHGADGNGEADGSTPRIAGQHFRVLAKQLVDFRSGKRWDFRMEGAAEQHHLTGSQDIADVAAYVAKMDSPGTRGIGNGEFVEEGSRIYSKQCASCHGPAAEGNATRRAAPRGPALWIPDAADVRRRRWPASGATATSFAAH